jgi:hypothetical protein
MRQEPRHADLEADLRRAAARFDPLPPALLDAAVGAFAWRTIDAELAELVFDSLTDHDEASLVRGAQPGRLLSFQSGDLAIEVEVTGTGASRRLTGQLMPPQQASVQIRHGPDVITVEADELGRFGAGSLHRGPIRLRCDPVQGMARSPVVTDWVSI